MVDEAQGPATKKEFELFESPAGASVFGGVSDFLGMSRIPDTAETNQGVRPNMGRPLPLLNQQVSCCCVCVRAWLCVCGRAVIETLQGGLGQCLS